MRFSYEHAAVLRVYSSVSLKKRKRKRLLDASPVSIPVDQSRGLRHWLCKEYGLGVAKAAQLKAALEIGRRLGLSQLDEKYQIKSPADAANLVMMEMAFLDHEQMRILVLDTKNRVVENISRYQGTVNSSVLCAAEVYRPAVIRNCPAIIICHNHPSGAPRSA